MKFYWDNSHWQHACCQWRTVGHRDDSSHWIWQEVPTKPFTCFPGGGVILPSSPSLSAVKGTWVLNLPVCFNNFSTPLGTREHVHFVMSFPSFSSAYLFLCLLVLASDICLSQCFCCFVGSIWQAAFVGWVCRGWGSSSASLGHSWDLAGADGFHGCTKVGGTAILSLSRRGHI